MVERTKKLEDGTYPTVLSPSIRERDAERKLRRIMSLLKRAKFPHIVKACREAGTSLNTFKRYKYLYERGGEDAVRKALGTHRITIFHEQRS